MVKCAVNFSYSSLLFIIGLITLAGCSSDEKPPESGLSPEKMASILTDIHIAESRVSRLQLKSSDSSLMVFNKLKEEIWKKHKVDTMIYRSSYDYYMMHPKQMSQIYEEVNKKIDKQEISKNIQP